MMTQTTYTNHGITPRLRRITRPLRNAMTMTMTMTIHYHAHPSTRRASWWISKRRPRRQSLYRYHHHRHPPSFSANTEYMGWEDSLRVIVTDATPKKNGEGSQSKWGRIKNAFSRPGSSAGKRPRNDSIQERGNNANSSTLRANGTRSRNNSMRDRATNTDSSTSRESGASLTGASKTDKGK